jgi:hypothetical protein
VLAILGASYIALFVMEILAFVLNIQCELPPYPTYILLTTSFEAPVNTLHYLLGDTGCFRDLHNGKFTSVTRTGVSISCSSSRSRTNSQSH